MADSDTLTGVTLGRLWRARTVVVDVVVGLDDGLDLEVVVVVGVGFCAYDRT